MLLDRKTDYQFGFFLIPENLSAPARVAREAIVGLRKHFDPAPSSSPLRVRFGDATVEDSIVATAGQTVQVPTVTWSSGVWRMVWSPLRLDVYADARTYADVAEKPLALDAALARILPGLQGAAGQLRDLGFVVHRLVLVVSGERALEAGDPKSVAVVAEQFLASSVRDAAAKGDAWDVGARVDWGTHVDLGEDGLVPVHRIETVGTELSYTGAEPNLVLRAQWDVNTSPQRGTSALRPESFRTFFTAAARWISDRRSRVEGK